MVPLVPNFATTYSLLSNWARCQCIDVRSFRARGNQGTLLDIDFSLGHRARWLADTVLQSWISPAKIVDHHTHVPLFCSMLTLPGAIAWREQLLVGGAIRGKFAQGIRRFTQVESESLRRCPTCMAIDQSKLGCAHWRLFHQWPIARHCVLHGDLLESSCVNCHTPFMRSSTPRLADDPCPHCGCSEGLSKPWTPPPGYWPLLREMYRLLSRDDPFDSMEERQAPVLTRWSPRSLVSSFDRKGIPLPVLQTLDAWGVDSLPKLASELGEHWIWFDQPEKSAHIRQWPPLVTLAMSLAEHSTAANAPYFQLPPRLGSGNSTGAWAH
jgi:hypothetical protein